MSSTNSISGTGFMKWMPMNFSGRSVEAASRVIEIDDVLLATSVSRLQRRAELREDLALDLFLLGRGFDHQIAIGQTVVGFDRADQLERRLLLLLGDALTADLAGHVAVDRGQRLLEARGRDIVDHDRDPGQRADMGDTVAHLARADDPDLANALRHDLGPTIPIVADSQRLILANSA